MRKIILLLTCCTTLSFAYGQEGNDNGNQRAFYACSKPIGIYPSQIEVKPGKVYFYFNTAQSPAALLSAEYPWLNDDPEEYFIGYLANKTDSTFFADRQDGSLIMIQEALDENGNWKPIEYWVHSGCGNSYFNPLKLESGECVVIPVKKYTGSFKTKCRLKFKYGNDILYSDTFEASINKAQFKRKTDPVRGILYHGPANYLDRR